MVSKYIVTCVQKLVCQGDKELSILWLAMKGYMVMEKYFFFFLITFCFTSRQTWKNESALIKGENKESLSSLIS